MLKKQCHQLKGWGGLLKIHTFEHKR